MLIVSAIGMVTVPLWAAISDRIGRRKTYLFGAIATALFITPFFALVDTGSALLIITALAIGLNLCHDAMYGPQAAWFVELFDTKVRYSGTSIAFQLGAVVSGAFSPLIAAALVSVGDGQPWLICGYVILMSVGTIVAAVLAPETRDVPTTYVESS
jgi:MFS family permease